MTSDQDEHRADRRRRTLKSGKIVFNDGKSIIDCVVRDSSAGGARLECESFVDCPKEFTLRLANGPSYECEVTWMKVKAAGVKFVRVTEDAG